MAPPNRPPRPGSGLSLSVLGELTIEIVRSLSPLLHKTHLQFNVISSLMSFHQKSFALNSREHGLDLFKNREWSHNEPSILISNRIFIQIPQIKFLF